MLVVTRRQTNLCDCSTRRCRTLRVELIWLLFVVVVVVVVVVVALYSLYLATIIIDSRVTEIAV